MAYLKARRILYSGKKKDLAEVTGLSYRTIFNRQREPEKTTIQELACIAKAKGLTGAEVMEVLDDLA